jgi:hypothetical protein
MRKLIEVSGMRVFPRLLLVTSFVVSVALGTAVVQAAPPEGMPGPNDTWKLPNRDAMNANTVTIITAPAGGATSIFGSDMARVLDDGNIRVLPVLGKGPVRNVVDILYLKAIDMGMVVSDVPEFYRLQYKIPDITSQLATSPSSITTKSMSWRRLRSNRFPTWRENGSWPRPTSAITRPG